MSSDFIPSNSILIKYMPSTLMWEMGRCWLYGECARKNKVLQPPPPQLMQQVFFHEPFADWNLCQTLDDEIWIKIYKLTLVGGFNPFENIMFVKMGSSSPKIGVKIQKKNVWSFTTENPMLPNTRVWLEVWLIPTRAAYDRYDVFLGTRWFTGRVYICKPRQPHPTGLDVPGIRNLGSMVNGSMGYKL